MWFIFSALLIWFFIYIGNKYISNEILKYEKKLENVNKLSNSFNSFLKKKNDKKLKELVTLININRFDINADIEYFYQNLSGNFKINKLSGWLDIFISNGGKLINSTDQNFINNIFDIIRLNLIQKIENYRNIQTKEFGEFKILKIGINIVFSEFTLNKNKKQNIFFILLTTLYIISSICTILGIHIHI